MDRMTHSVLLIGLAALLAGCVDYKINDPQALSETWNRGFVIVPPRIAGTEYGCSGAPYLESTKECLAKIPTSPKVPFVVFIHGCAGPQYEYARVMASLGFAAGAPISGARSVRPRDCEAGPLKPTIIQMRVAEAAYALEQAKLYSWVDPDRIFLMGFSEGGMAVAVYPHPGYKAHIILGWTCTHRRHPSLDGIRAPEDTPVLAVWGTKDETVKSGAANDGNCGQRMRGRPNARFVPIENGAHRVIDYPEAREAINAFLAEHSG